MKEAITLKVKILDEKANLPEHAKPGDAGLDLESMKTVKILPGETIMVPTGIKVEIPQGYFGMLVPRSGVAVNKDLAPVNSPGIIDSGYRGEIKAAMHNYGQSQKIVGIGERICQLVIVPFARCNCVQVDDLSDSERGEGGFGSTGVVHEHKVSIDTMPRHSQQLHDEYCGRYSS